ncbi:Fc.00g002030.m01.CDS01 [Cosmosporella sp. VM-42]
MTSITQEAPPIVRQRKSHRKSRLGCGNCKLRSVKCDEAKPTCTRCLTSGFTCNYTRSVPSLQLAHTGAFKLDLSTPSLGLPAPAPRLRIPVALPVPGKMGEYEMRESDFAALDRFRKRTALTVGNQATRHLYTEGAYGLGTAHPYLLHIFLAFALIHDVHLNPSLSSAKHRSSLAFHWYHGTALFKHYLIQPNLSGSERDALWAAAALLGSSSFAYIGSSNPEEAWPARKPEETDLDWLKMSDGKKVVWHIADPTRPDSMFHPLVNDHSTRDIPDGFAPISPSALPSSIYSLYNLNTSSPTGNPYHVAASIIAQLLPREIDDDNIIIFLTFISQLDPRYRRLLEEKDPRAMLLLAWWYSQTVVHRVWWLRQRSLMEGQAIIIYLEKHCQDEPRIIELLDFPRGVFETVKRQGKNGEDKSLGAALAIRASLHE